MSQRSVILATASYDRTIRFWKARSGSCYRTIYYPALPQRELLPVENQNNQNKPQHVNRLEISPNKCHLAAACNPYIRLFDVNFSRAHVRTFVSHTRNVTAVGFYSDGNSLYSGSEDGTVKIWDLRAPNRNEDYEWNCRKTCHSHGSVIPINTVALHPNQIELISGDQNGSIRILDTRMNMCRLELVPEAGTAIRSLSVMWDGKMMVAANDRGTCYIWSVSPGTGQALTEFEPHQRLQAHNSQILKCALSPESIYLATASSDKTVKIWNVGDFTLHRVLTGHERWVWDCAFSVDAKFLVSASSDMTARLWSMETGIEMQVYRGHHRATVCCALSD